MNEMRVSITELQSMTYTDASLHCVERIVDMYLRLGEVNEALKWKWKLAAKLQKGE